MNKKIDYLYLHFPFCAQLCNYCDFYKKVPKNLENEIILFQNNLEESFSKHKILIEKNGYSMNELKTLYFGGGTPSLWGSLGVDFLKDQFKKYDISFSLNAEITLEVNPKAWTEESINKFRDFGVNRFSVGIQAFDERLIKNLNRVHTLEDSILVLDYFHKLDANFSVDIMLGLPFSEDYNRDVIWELKQILKFNPSHFSIYILTVKDNYKFYNNLPSEEWIEKEFQLVSEFLIENGFLHYEVSNFSLPNMESKHNLAYWNSSSVGAIGPSATGFMSEVKTRYKWQANKNEFDLEVLTEEELKVEKIYMALRSKIGINLSDFLDKDKAERILKKWKSANYILEEDPVLKLNSKGYLILDSLMNDLFWEMK